MPSASGLADSGLADSGYLKDEEDSDAPSPTVSGSRALRALLHAGQRQLLDQAKAQRKDVHKKLQAAQKTSDNTGRRYRQARDFLDGLHEEFPPELRQRQELLQRSRKVAEQVKQIRSEASELESRLVHLESTDAIQRWVRRYGEESDRVRELRSSLRQQRSELQTARARLEQLEAEHAGLQFQISALPTPSDATIAAITRAEAELLSLQCEAQQCHASVSGLQRRMGQADVRLQAAVRLASRQARANVGRLREDHRKQLEVLRQAAVTLVATLDQNSHVRLNVGSFTDWRAYQQEACLPDSNHLAGSQYHFATRELEAVNQYLFSELAGLSSDRHGRFVADVHADLGVHFIIEAANALLEARESFTARHNQLSQALGLLRAAGLAI